MSEPPKKTRSRKQDVQLVVSCDAPKEAVEEGRSTSVYEIDIQGGYDLHRRDKRGCLEKDLKETSTKESEKALHGACRESGQEEVEGRLEAHYPKLMEAFSANQRSSRTQNASFIVTRDILTDGNKGKERKSFIGKTNKKRQPMPTDTKQKFRKHIKNYIIETFIGDKCREMKNIVQNYHGVLDGNEVHLHHHEHHHHHHHYYANGNALDSETVPQTPIQENLSESPETFLATVTGSANGQETILNDQVTEVENSSCSHYPCPSRSLGPANTQEDSSDPLARENSEESDPPPSEGRSSAFVHGTHPKNGLDSTSSLKSRTGETGTILIENPECSVVESAENRGIKEEKSKSSKSYTSLVENFKSFNHLMSPIVITDQMTVPKILYIRCECSPWKETGTPEEADTFQSKNSGGKDDPERKADDGEEKNNSETDQSVNSMPNQCHGAESEESSEEIAFEVWTSRLKKELQEIKKEIKRIEEKQVVDKRSTNTSFRKEKTNEGGSDHEITVYSNKTFIMRPSQDAAAEV